MCEEMGVEIKKIEEKKNMEMKIEGEDEVEGEIRIIKGGGGEMIREKIVDED